MAQPYYDPAQKPQELYGSQQQQPAMGQPLYATQQLPNNGAGGTLLTLPVPMGSGGLPMARPRFITPAEDTIRRPQGCCDYGPGPNIPLHWFDGGSGWVTRYFYDYVLRNPEAYEPGKYRCQVLLPNGQHCNHEVSESDCCKGNCCWASGATAHIRMDQHLRSAHMLSPPPRRQWTTELFDTEGCCDAYFCAPCIGARMMMALAGWEEKFHWGWCLFFTLLGCRSAGSGRNQIVYWIPPHVYVALMTRNRIVTLNNIDEGFCTTFCTSLCCPLCSMTQTYRELTASGVWPGSYCNNLKPPYYASVGVSAPPINKSTMV